MSNQTIINKDNAPEVVSMLIGMLHEFEALKEENKQLKKQLGMALKERKGLTIVEAVNLGRNFIRCPQHDSYPLYRQNYQAHDQTLCFTKEELLSDEWECVENPDYKGNVK